MHLRGFPTLRHILLVDGEHPPYHSDIIYVHDDGLYDELVSGRFPGKTYKRLAPNIDYVVLKSSPWVLRKNTYYVAGALTIINNHANPEDIACVSMMLEQCGQSSAMLIAVVLAFNAGLISLLVFSNGGVFFAAMWAEIARSDGSEEGKREQSTRIIEKIGEVADVVSSRTNSMKPDLENMADRSNKALLDATLGNIGLEDEEPDQGVSGDDI